MNEGYLLVKCLRCGSISQMAIKAVRSNVSQCPVCLDGEIQCSAVQPSIQMYQEHLEHVNDLHVYLSSHTGFSSN